MTEGTCDGKQREQEAYLSVKANEKSPIKGYFINYMNPVIDQ